MIALVWRIYRKEIIIGKHYMYIGLLILAVTVFFTALGVSYSAADSHVPLSYQLVADSSGTQPDGIQQNKQINPDDIKKIATDTEQFLGAMVQAARSKMIYLKKGQSNRIWILKVGQYIGGGGAAIFGLNDQGRNAGWAGVVAATKWGQVLQSSTYHTTISRSLSREENPDAG